MYYWRGSLLLFIHTDSQTATETLLKMFLSSGCIHAWQGLYGAAEEEAEARLPPEFFLRGERKLWWWDFLFYSL